uniref:Uncharacterized protein n=1 Tax=Avena sativa TaxID=4498 RepID=A0ACD5X1I6_AVESA
MDGAAAAATTARRPFPRDASRDVRRRQENNKENTSHQGSNEIMVQKHRQTEWTKPGRVFNRNINRGGQSRSSFPGVTQEFRVVKDNRTKPKGDAETLPGSFHNGDSSNERAVLNGGDKSSTEKAAAQHQLVIQKSDGRGTTQADNGSKIAAEAHGKQVKLSSDQGPEQSESMKTPLVGSHSVLEKGNQYKVLTPSGTNNFTGELCCSSSDPIHVPPPGSRPVGTFGAIKREVGVAGARQQPSETAATNTSTSNSLVKVTTAMKNNASNEKQSRLSSFSTKTSNPFPTSQYHSKPGIYVGHSKGNQHLEWKPKSISPANVARSSATSVDDNQVGITGLSMKLSEANVSEDERVIIPEHLRVPDSERTNFIFGTFESDAELKVSTSAPDATSKEGSHVNSSTSLASLNYLRPTDDVRPSDQTNLLGSFATIPQSDSVLPSSEQQQSLTVDMEVLSPGVIGEHRTNEMISSKIHSLPQPQHQDNSVPQNFKAYEPDSMYKMPFITKSVDGETVQTRSYPSEVSVSSAIEQPVPHMYQQVQVSPYPNFLPYRHVFSPYYAPPVAVPNYSSSPAFPQLPHASSYLVMPNAAPHEIGSMKYGPPHQYKQMFPGSPAGYGSYANQNGYPVSNVIGSTGTVEDASMSKYKDNNTYGPNQQVT